MKVSCWKCGGYESFKFSIVGFTFAWLCCEHASEANEFALNSREYLAWVHTESELLAAIARGGDTKRNSELAVEHRKRMTGAIKEWLNTPAPSAEK